MDRAYDWLLAHVGLRAANWLAYGSQIAAALFTGVGLFADIITFEVRLVLIGAALVCAAIGITASACRRRALELETASRSDLVMELEAARDQLQSAAPERTLDALATALFVGPAAWRLTVYRVEQDDGQQWWMHRILRRSGSQQYESSGRDRVALRYSVLRELPNFDLTNARIPFVNQSGSFPSRETNPDEWEQQQISFLADHDSVRALQMPTRKYAWCATRDSVSRKTVALVVESVDPDGVNVEVLGSPVVAPWLGMIARSSELQDAAVAPMEQAAEILKSSVASDHDS